MNIASSLHLEGLEVVLLDIEMQWLAHIMQCFMKSEIYLLHFQITVHMHMTV